jgi:hypothetical protein
MIRIQNLQNFCRQTKKNNISTNNKMPRPKGSEAPKKKFGNTDTQLYEGMLGGSMEEMGLSDIKGEGIVSWLQNLYDVIRKPSDALSGMPKKIWEFQDEYGDWTVTSWEVCREPLSSGLTKFIDLASRGQLLKNKDKLKYDDIFHLYSNIYLKDSKTGKTKGLRLEKNQRVNIFPIVPYKKGGSCMSVPNIPSNLIFRTLINKDTDKTTWEYSADRFNCQDYTKKRLEATGLLTEPLRNFVMQNIQELLPDAKIQIQIAKGVTNAASIFENIMQGGMMCNCGEKCGCEKKGGWIESHVHLKQGKYPDITGDNTNTWASDYAGRGKKKTKKQRGGWIEPHIHQVWPREGVGWSGEAVGQYYDPNFGKH